ncbi:MAG: protease modulator HflC, partial [Candidatus Omnitrophica bacterium]|nr:protease modulator HflC [Candidatus Omnitrophota bacterium]
MNKIHFPLLILLILFIIVSPFVFYTIDETEQAVILQIGDPVRVIVNRVTPTEFEEIANEIREATQATVGVSYGSGLYMRIPFIQTVQRLEARILEFDEQPRDIVTVDKYQLSVDSYARWRIRNPLQFYLSVRDRSKATQRLRTIVGSELRKELGKKSHYEIIRSSTNPIQVMGAREGEYELYSQQVKEGREVLMANVTRNCNMTSRDQRYGIEVVDVRIKRADLPKENAESVYRRMIEERNRIANRYRMEGSRESDIITSETDRKVKTLLATAEKESLRIR